MPWPLQWVIRWKSHPNASRVMVASRNFNLNGHLQRALDYPLHTDNINFYPSPPSSLCPRFASQLILACYATHEVTSLLFSGCPEDFSRVRRTLLSSGASFHDVVWPSFVLDHYFATDSRYPLQGISHWVINTTCTVAQLRNICCIELSRSSISCFVFKLTSTPNQRRPVSLVAMHCSGPLVFKIIVLYSMRSSLGYCDFRISPASLGLSPSSVRECQTALRLPLPYWPVLHRHNRHNRWQAQRMVELSLCLRSA
jgi:hypothetical protein